MLPTKKLNVFIGLSRIWATKTLGISATKIGDLTIWPSWETHLPIVFRNVMCSRWVTGHPVIPNVDSWTYYDPLLQLSGVKSENWKPCYSRSKNVNLRSSEIVQNYPKLKGFIKIMLPPPRILHVPTPFGPLRRPWHRHQPGTPWPLPVVPRLPSLARNRSRAAPHGPSLEWSPGRAARGAPWTVQLRLRFAPPWTQWESYL